MALTLLTTAPLQAPRAWRQAALAGWERLDVAVQTRVKLATMVISVVVAYHYSLYSLLQTVGYDTPLAYIGLVPVLAAGLAALRRRPRSEPHIHDRQLDYILGVPLMAVAIAVVALLPSAMGEMYWVDRIDLLSLPLFVAAATILLFGTRVAWRQKAAIAYLLLAWPWPYTTLLLGALGGFTSVTLSGLRLALKVLPVASAVPGADNAGVFQVAYHGHHFPISVVTACSGVDGMVGFLLVGLLFSAVVEGPKLRKGLWLAAGLVLLWTTNLGRLLLIFWVGGLAGEHVAINVLHPVAGIIIFCIGIVLMVVLLKPFGLRLADADVARRPAPVVIHRPGTSKVYMAGAILLAASILLGVNNSTLTQYDPVATASGDPKLGSFLAQPASPQGWAANYDTEYLINKPLFGQSSRWFRYTFSPTGAKTDLHSTLPITADVINAGGLSGFSQYGVTACYSFHGYTLRDVAKVDLGDGISGQALSYSGNTEGRDWSIVYWVWPVKTGSGTRYERIILYLQNTSAQQVRLDGKAAQIQGLKGALSATDPLERRLLTNRVFLVAFAKEIIAGQLHQADTTVLISSLHPGLTTMTVGLRTGTGAATTSALSKVSSSQAERLREYWATHHTNGHG